MSAGPGYDSALRRATPLAKKLVAHIKQTGPLALADYMAACLQDSDFGYYRSRAGIGSAGDFVTAPEISQVFGELIGLWCVVVWQQMGAPKQLTLVEMGPGRGTMMRDALRAAQVMPEFLSAVVVELVESSDPLRAVQKETLKNAGVPVRWSRRALDPHPETPLILLANEYFDAWPVDHLRFAPTGELEQKFVTIDARDTLQFEWQRASVGQEDGYGRQGQSNHPKWFNARDAAGRILEVHNTVGYGDGYVWPIININHAKAPSAALIIDYGHAATAAGETLQAVRAHTPEHVLTSPGEADLTAHVDFEELEKLTRHRGATPLSPTFEPLTTQAEFLTRLGVIERVTRLMRSNPGQANALETGAARLLAPNGMGTRFKVLGVRSADLPTLPGFKI